MMYRRRHRILDLFCKAGGAARGYDRAGFDVVGVDVEPQPRYPYEFVQGCAIDFLRLLIEGRGPEGWELNDFDAVHASPPCQKFTRLRMPNAKRHPDLVTPTLALLRQCRRPWVVENVPGAPIDAHLILCGSMFGLGTGEAELRRHRHFELGGFFCFQPDCRHGQRKVIGVYGGGGKDKRRPSVVGVWGNAGGKMARDGTQQFNKSERAEAMGIDWMTVGELSQAVPPAYTKYIGGWLLKALKRRRE